MARSNFLIYGAYGYTGRLIARKALEKGLRPVLAGRDAAQVAAMAAEMGLDFCVFELSESPDFLEKNGISAQKGISTVLHCAGPFAFTGRQMMVACLRAGCHYVDITGEFGVFEAASALGPDFERAGLMLMPGGGFDIVPTDCLALALKKALPDAVELQLAFAAESGGAPSRGTLRSMLNKASDGGLIRVDGQLRAVPLGHKAMEIDFGPKTFFCMAIPWGDVATAYWTTGIPNIEVFSRTSPSARARLRWAAPLLGLLKLPFLKKWALRRIEKMPAGPSDEQLGRGKTYLWGRAQNARGQRAEARLETGNGYALTAETAVAIVEKILNGQFRPGRQTPAGCYGAGLIEEMAAGGPIRIV